MLTSWTSQAPDACKTEQRKILLKMPMSTWYHTAKHALHLRLFHCTAVVMCAPVLRADTLCRLLRYSAAAFADGDRQFMC